MKPVKKTSIKALVTKIIKSATSRNYTFARMLAEQCVLTDGRFVVYLDTKEATKALAVFVEAGYGADTSEYRCARTFDVAKHIPKHDRTPARVLGERDDTDNGWTTYVLENERGERFEINRQFAAEIRGRHRDAVMYAAIDVFGLVVFKVGDRVVGLVMPIVGPDNQKEKEAYRKMLAAYRAAYRAE